MITIVLNGENKTINDDTNIEQLLQSLSLGNKRLAVEINQEIGGIVQDGAPFPYKLREASYTHSDWEFRALGAC